MKRAYLLTGRPGSGKTTLIKEALRKSKIAAGGFYTEEIRVDGVRQGFRIVTLDGRIATLAHANLRGPRRVSRYGVDTSSLDRVGVTAIREAVAGKKLVVIDEIGKMELFSEAFRDAASEALDSGRPVLGTIMLAPHPWADEIKRDPNVGIAVVTKETRQEARAALDSWLSSIAKEE